MGEQYSRTGPTTVRSKLTMLQGFTPALLRSTKKRNLLLTLLIASELENREFLPINDDRLERVSVFLKVSYTYRHSRSSCGRMNSSRQRNSTLDVT